MNNIFRDTKVLVTGGAGFLGSHLVNHLCSYGADVTILDNLNWPSEALRNIKEININYSPEIIVSDITDFEKTKKVISENNFDYIIHFAALPSHRLALEKPLDYVLIDSVGTANLLEAIRLRSDKNKPIMLLGSTNKVYGKQKTPWREDMPLLPEGPYSITKAFSEELCYQYNKYYGIDSVVLRYHHVAGIRSNRDLALSIFVERVLNNLPPEVHGMFDGDKFISCSADYTHVNDAITATLLALEKYNKFDIFNICNSNLTNVLDMANIVIKELNSDVKPKLVDMLPHETLCHHSDNTKAEKLLGFKATLPIEQAIKEYIRWRLSYGDKF